jgi:hypothetical protein
MAPASRTTIVCDVSAVPADLLAIDALARLQLAARRRGLDIELRRPSLPLRALVELSGLRDVLRFEAVREAEQREQPLGVEEERELGDSAV